MSDTQTPDQGLTPDQAQALLLQEGYNELPSSPSRAFFVLIRDILFEPMFSLIIACGVIYFLIGDPRDALILLGFLGIIVVITVFQERRTHSALQSLKSLTSPRALVLRDGVMKRIPGREVVRGDLIFLHEGDRVPADALVLESTSLMTDESLLTGESTAVRKSVRSPVYAGTSIIQGKGRVRVTATGIKTEMGRIGKFLGQDTQAPTQIQEETRRWVQRLALIAGVLCIAVVLAFGFLREEWLNGILSGLTLAMAILPNELPAVIFIFLALGAWRISKKNVLTRRMHAVENLGTATVLCVDKTGTLTLNEMRVQRICIPHRGGWKITSPEEEALYLPPTFQDCIRHAILASHSHPFDPMEKAILRFRSSLPDSITLQNLELKKTYPVSSNLFMMTQAWINPQGSALLISSKGAPEAVLECCSLSEEKKSDILLQVHQLATQGLRVLAVGKSHLPSSSPLPGEQNELSLEFLGLIALADPIRPNVISSIHECHHAGIRVYMITGDHALTAQAIAREIGLPHPEHVITGKELDEMSDPQFQKKLSHTFCFARIRPDQKLRIVETLKAMGERVAMTGDGINDAPALRRAQIGIAMGERGTDVAREAADLVLTHDDFYSIVESIRVGRGIFENLQNAIAYLLAVHIPIAGMSILPVLFDLPLVLLPIHIAFLHLIIEPACSIVFEAEPPHDSLMKQPPRRISEALFHRKLILPSLIQGSGVLVITLGVFIVSLYRHQGEEDARALTFTTLIFANMSLILVNRSWRSTIPQGLRVHNSALYWILGSSLFTLGLILYVPTLRQAFQFSVLHPIDLFISLTGGIFSILWFEGWKIYHVRRKASTFNSVI